MIISKSKNFIFIHLDKCGGTSITEALRPYLNEKDIVLGSPNQFIEDDLEKYYMKKHRLLKHSGTKPVKQYLGNEWNSMYRFATVRDPIDMLTSLYYFTKKYYDPNIIDPHFEVYKYSIESGTGIDGFIKLFIVSNTTSAQSYLYRLDKDIEIFDISDINKHWNYILNKINISEQISLPILNKSEKPKNILLKDETVKLIKERFEEDYLTIPKITGVKWK